MWGLKLAAKVRKSGQKSEISFCKKFLGDLAFSCEIF